MTLRDNLQRDAARALRVAEATEIGVDGDVSEAIQLMRENRAGCVVVVEDGAPVGILTERDILTKVLSRDLPGGTPIADIMTSPPELIHQGQSVAAVIKRMHQGGFRHMPVVNESEKLCGVVSVKRIVEYLADHFPAAVFNLPPEPTQQQLAREGA